MRKSHLFDSKNIELLELEERKIWQNPEEILGTVEIKPDFSVADVGCGSGFLTIPLSQKVKKVYAIDVQTEMLDFLEKKIRKFEVKNIQLLFSKENEIPLENECVDLLVSVNTLHEFDDKEKMIAEIKRVLKNSGKVLIVDFKKKHTDFGPPINIRVSKEQALSIFRKGGFANLKWQDLQQHYLLVFSKLKMENKK